MHEKVLLWSPMSPLSVSAYLRIGGCASGRRQAQARCTWSGVWAPGLTAPARPRVSPATAGTLAAGSRQLWGDSRLGSIGDSAVTSDGVIHEASQHDAVHYSEKTLTTVLSVKCSLRHWVNTLQQVTRVFLLWWCFTDCALWMPPDMTIASMFCLGHGRKRTQLPLSDSILLDQRDEKPKASGEFSSNCRKKIEFRRFLMDSKLGYNKTF